MPRPYPATPRVAHHREAMPRQMSALIEGVYERRERRVFGCNHQDDKVSSFGVVFAKDTVFAAETNVDAQISDAFDNGLEMVLQAYNLTDTPNRSFWGEPNLPGYLQSFGREYSLGVSYSF